LQKGLKFAEKLSVRSQYIIISDQKYLSRAKKWSQSILYWVEQHYWRNHSK